MPKNMTYTNRNDEKVELPAKWELCERCDGDGSVDHPAFSNGITSSEWEEWDDDDRDNYMSGRYDVICPCCKGDGKVLVPDTDRCDPDDLKEYYDILEAQDMYEAERASERRYGA